MTLTVSLAPRRPNVVLTPSNVDLTINDVGTAGPQGPPGADGESARYVHTQSVSSATWTINHALNRKPSGIVVIDSGGTVQFGEVTYPTSNQVVIAFSAAFSGTAELI